MGTRRGGNSQPRTQAFCMGRRLNNSCFRVGEHMLSKSYMYRYS